MMSNYLRFPVTRVTLVICDERDIIKNPRSAIACTLNKVRTHRRIILTGTPMQNNLKEYFSMVNFCKPNFLGTEREFSHLFRQPIQVGQHRDSLAYQVKIMRSRVSDVNILLKNIIHRRDFDVLRSYLPPKFEYAIKIKCRPMQRTLYETYINYHRMNSINTNLIRDLQAMFRSYRLDQAKPVYIYCLIVKGTMEEKKIYKRQITKQVMSHRLLTFILILL
ncbi:unnamed protein product [Rotaria magnacalcarata]|uniref:Helicase ATP-binding domain-containing protein n=1 Tax=Rotaria magnacalcarata TaxID=392030 RepID=A0A816NFM7_9BILA|nr:unnamed protein product [Rotaria magnacalcarata]CAF3839577.1 unnamed protein product [Rotaria magnacalcarata]